uniref:Uncharacterized protein n=1 Tax=Plectus sambesii TaxID=2011161 RepID=A0A914X9V7_9BILA
MDGVGDRRDAVGRRQGRVDDTGGRRMGRKGPLAATDYKRPVSKARRRPKGNRGYWLGALWRSWVSVAGISSSPPNELIPSSLGHTSSLRPPLVSVQWVSVAGLSSSPPNELIPSSVAVVVVGRHKIDVVSVSCRRLLHSLMALLAPSA